MGCNQSKCSKLCSRLRCKFAATKAGVDGERKLEKAPLTSNPDDGADDVPAMVTTNAPSDDGLDDEFDDFYPAVKEAEVRKSLLLAPKEDATTSTNANEPQQKCTDPRRQILTYFNSVSDEISLELTMDDEEEEAASSTASLSIAEDPSSMKSLEPTVQSQEPPATNHQNFQAKSSSSLLSNPAISPAVFTVWRPTSAEAIRKMVEGEGVGKGLEIKGKSSKAGVLSGFVPYLQIHKEVHKSMVKTMDRGGRTRIFFATEEARDKVMEELGPLQNHIVNAVQDAKRTVKKSVLQVLYVPHHAKKKVKKAGKVAKKTAKKTGKVAVKTAVLAGSTVSQATSTVSTSVVSVGGAVGGAVATAGGAVGGAVATAGGAVSSGAKKGLYRAGGSMSAVVSSAGGAVAKVTNPVSSTVARVTNPVSSTVAHITSPVKIGVQKSVSMTAKGVSKAAGTVSGTVTSSVSMAGKGVSMATATVTGTVSSSVNMAGNIVKKTGKVAKKTHKVAKKTVTTVGGAVVTAGGAVSSGARRGLSEAGESVSSLSLQATASVSSAGSAVVKLTNPVSNTVARRASLIGAQASNTAKTVGKGIGIAKGDGEEDEVEFALKRLLWDMDDPSIRKIDDYNPRCYGIELPDRLLWQAFVADSDISRPEDSRWYNARPSQPAFQDMNLIAISKSRKNQKKKKMKRKKKKKKPQDPLVVLWQTCTGDGEDDDVMDPRGLVMAYEECGRVLPVVSDFDCFTMGSRQIRYDVLPEDQIKLLDWCVSNIEGVLENQVSSKNATWTDRWLEVLKSSAKKGFHPEIPKYGFGDAKSYGIVKNAVTFLQESGAVRHGAECFNFYFPQDLDEEWLIVSESLPDDPKWRYVGAEELLDFLFERVKEGFTFPLNPKWVLCDDARWKELYDCLLASEAPCVQESLEAWMPKTVRDKIEVIRARYPEGFVSDKPKDDEVCGTEAMDLAMLDLDRLIIFRRARNKLWLMGIFLKLLRTVRSRNAELESDDEFDLDEDERSQDTLGEEENFVGGDGSEFVSTLTLDEEFQSRRSSLTLDEEFQSHRLDVGESCVELPIEEEGSQDALDEGEILNGGDGNDELRIEESRSVASLDLEDSSRGGNDELPVEGEGPQEDLKKRSDKRYAMG